MKAFSVNIKNLLIAVVVFAFSPLADAQSVSSLEPAMRAATSINDIVSVIAKFGEFDSSIAERLVVYDQIPHDILDVRDTLTSAHALIATPADIPYTTEFIYLTALDARLKAKLFTRITKLRLQDILRKQFLATADDWRIETASGMALGSIEPRAGTEALDKEKMAEFQAQRITNVAQVLIESMDEAEKASLAKRRGQWRRESTTIVKNEKSEIRRERRKDVKQSFAADFQEIRESGVGRKLHSFMVGGILVSGVAVPHLIGGLTDLGFTGHAVGALMDLMALNGGATIISSRKGNFDLRNGTKKKFSEIEALGQARENALDAFFNEISGVPAERKSTFRCIAGVLGKK